MCHIYTHVYTHTHIYINAIHKRYSARIETNSQAKRFLLQKVIFVLGNLLRKKTPISQLFNEFGADGPKSFKGFYKDGRKKKWVAFLFFFFKVICNRHFTEKNRWGQHV